MQILEKLRKDAGQSQSLMVLLGIVTGIFVIGILVMIYALIGGSVKSSTTDATAIKVINDTVNATSGVTTYFPLFITIGSMVVLVLLTVIVIVALRGATGSSGGTG
jgi:hypothetical protein